MRIRDIDKFGPVGEIVDKKDILSAAFIQGVDNGAADEPKPPVTMIIAVAPGALFPDSTVPGDKFAGIARCR